MTTPRTEKKTQAKDDAPWDHKNPRQAAGKASKPLTPSQKATAKRHAKEAGRPYPNLIDNMQVAKSARASKK